MIGRDKKDGVEMDIEKYTSVSKSSDIQDNTEGEMVSTVDKYIKVDYCRGVPVRQKESHRCLMIKIECLIIGGVGMVQ